MSQARALPMIVLRSLRLHALSSSVTIASAALASGLVLAVFCVAHQSRVAFQGGDLYFDAVLGARGSPLQLVLNTVYHLETSPGNLPWSAYQEVRSRPGVELAVPYAVGDSFRGFRVVGTTVELFQHFDRPERPRLGLYSGGRVFDPECREAVIGSAVALSTGLRVNSTFHPSHDVFEAGAEEHEEEYLVTGILQPTYSPMDRVVWIPIEGIFRMGGHELKGGGEVYHAEDGQPIPDEHKEVSAVMLVLDDFRVGNALSYEFNRKGKEATLAFPISSVMGEIFVKLGWMARVLELVAYLVMAVAAGSILASLHNTMNERRRGFAILRALGARRRTVFSAIVLEAAAIATSGAVLGFAVYFAIAGLAASIIRRETGVVLDVWAAHPALVWAPLGMIALGALAGLLPAFKAYSTDVATHLAGTGG